MDAIQTVIEDLAQILQRSVALDDADLQLIASSSHFADADRARVESLVGRRADEAATNYVFGQGIRTWRSPGSLPANPQIGADTARYCVPLWSRYELCGFLWVMEKVPLTQEEVTRVAEAASRVRELLTRQVKAESERQQELEASTLALLSSDVHEQATAVQDLSEYGLLKGSTHFTVVVASLNHDEFENFAESPTGSIRRAFAHLAQTRSTGMTISGVSDTDSFLIFGHRTVFPRNELVNIGMQLLKEVGYLDPDLARHICVGIGSAQKNLMSIGSSFDQAQQAARQARRNEEVIAIWGEDALEALLDAVLSADCKGDLIPEVIRTLEKDHTEMLKMLEIFLDVGGNVHKVSELLHLHRTTVYYRVAKFQKVTGLDLEDGRTRLMLHLWIKSRRRYSLQETSS